MDIPDVSQFVTNANLNSTLNGYLKSNALTGYATQQWVNDKLSTAPTAGKRVVIKTCIEALVITDCFAMLFRTPGMGSGSGSSVTTYLDEVKSALGWGNDKAALLRTNFGFCEQRDYLGSNGSSGNICIGFAIRLFTYNS